MSLIGPDGVGKTTLVSRLQKALPMRVKYIYMGDNIESCNYVLPTTRWWKKRSLRHRKNVENLKPDSLSNPEKDRDLNLLQKMVRGVRKTVGFSNRILDLWYRYFMVVYFARRGYVVLLDRHFAFDYYHFDIKPQNGRRPLKRRLHGFLLKHTIPDPDLVICLDAPADVIYKRKGEFTIDYLQNRRDQYKSLKSVVPNFVVVDANRKLGTVIEDVSNLICSFHQERLNHA
ncbi:hypothetical protein GWO09_02395 [candidate division KSB1 bacterium]|nr:hypothetical protein [candidate division KSB1 bacterium]